MPFAARQQVPQEQVSVFTCKESVRSGRGRYQVSLYVDFMTIWVLLSHRVLVMKVSLLRTNRGGPTIMPDVQQAGSAPPAKGDERPVVLATHGLTKSFGDTLAVDHLDLVVRKGDVFGFLGPNGAGKTTTIRMIFGLIYPTSGYARVLDHIVPADKREALRHIGGFVEVPAFYANMSARRNLSLLGSLNGHVDGKRVDEVLDIVGLLGRATAKVGDYSHGMKQRLGIANALLHKPEVIILDEPTSGLDPQGMKDVRELIRELGRGGTTVFLSSHLLHEIEQICNRAVIINKGRVVVEGPVSDLRPASTTVKVLTSDQIRAREILATVVGQEQVAVDEEYLVVQGADGTVQEMVRRLVAGGVGVDAVIPAHEQGLEDFFLGLTESSDVDAGRTATVTKGGAQ
jgi:ABC-2 type transport system ATP-binding protein